LPALPKEMATTSQPGAARQSTASPPAVVKVAATPRVSEIVPSLSASTCVRVSGSQAPPPVRQTLTVPDPCSGKPEPVIVREAWSGRSVDGVTVRLGPGRSGPSGRKWSGARAARGEST
jgi:hypothetical protein